MKKFVLIGLALALVALGITARWWLPPLLGFVGAHGDAIQSITSLVQLAIWAGAGVVAVVIWARSRSKPEAAAAAASPAPDPPAPSAEVKVEAARSVRIGGNVNNSSIFTGDVHMHEAEPVATSLHQLPAPPPEFTDREMEMRELREQFENGVNIYVLWGMGGVGKSDLAFKLAAELSRHYADGEIHLDLRGTSKEPLPVAEIMAHVIHSYNQAAVIPQKDDRLQAMYRSVLYGKRALLLMDNAVNSEQLEHLLQPGCAIVITSRQRLVVPTMFDINVNPLLPKDARELLMKITDRVNEAQADKIAELCGYLPLALKVAGKALEQRRTISVESYVRRLGAASERLELVEASLSLSYELLSPEQQKLFSALAVFPDTFDVKAAEAVWALPTTQTEDALADLVAFSLVEWREATARYRLQELVRIFADARLGEADREAYRKRHALHFLRATTEAGELYFLGGAEAVRGLGLFDADWPNIHAAQEWAKTHITEDEVAEAVSGSYSYAGASLLAVRRLPLERISWHETGAAVARQTKRRGVEGANLCFIGGAYRDLGNYDKTIEYCQRAREIAREEKDGREESRALSYIGIAHYYQSEYSEAIEYCQKALDITREVGGDKRAEIEQLRYLGHARRGLGQFEEAVKNYEQSLEIARQIGDRNGENNVLGALGRIYTDMGQHERAIKEYLPEAIRVASEIGDRRGESASRAHLGLAYRDMGQYEKAKECYEQALPIASAIGEQSIEAYCLGGLGKVHFALGAHDAAIKSTFEAIELADRIEMKRAQQYWRTSLAQIYLRLDRGLPDALKILDEALTHDTIWNNHHSFAIKGLILARLGQAAPAHEAFNGAAEHARQVLRQTPGYYDAKYTLGLAACGMGLGAAGEERAALLGQARAAYEDALSSCSSPGIIEEELSLLGELLRVDGAEELRPVYDLLKQRAPTQAA